MLARTIWLVPFGAFMAVGCGSDDDGKPKPRGGGDPIEAVDENEGSGGAPDAKNDGSGGKEDRPSYVPTGGSPSSGGGSHGGGSYGTGGAATGGASGTGATSGGGSYGAGGSASTGGAAAQCNEDPGTCCTPGSSDALITFEPVDVDRDSCSSTTCTLVKSTKDISYIAVDAEKCGEKYAKVELFESEYGKLGDEVHKSPSLTSGNDESCDACNVDVPDGMLKFDGLSKAAYIVCVGQWGFAESGDVRIVAKSGTACVQDATCNECRRCDD